MVDRPSFLFYTGLMKMILSQEAEQWKKGHMKVRPRTDCYTV